MTGKEMCETIVKALQKSDKVFDDLTPEQVWNISSTGELYPVFEMYRWAKSYLEGKENEANKSYSTH